MRDFIDMVKEIVEAVREIVVFYNTRRKYNPPPAPPIEEIGVCFDDENSVK